MCSGDGDYLYSCFSPVQFPLISQLWALVPPAMACFSVSWLHSRMCSLFCYFQSHEPEAVTCSSAEDFSDLVLSSVDLAPKCPMVCLESDTSALLMYRGRNVSHKVQETRGAMCLWFSCVLFCFLNIIIERVSEVSLVLRYFKEYKIVEVIFSS